MNKECMKKIIMAIVGIVFVGVGVAFNAAAALGNDPVGIVYDGLRKAANRSYTQLGMASHFVDHVLAVGNRHYVNIGTFIYIIPYGFCVDMGGKLYHLLFRANELPIQILGAATGCFLLYFGVSLYITADIGLDPFTGLVMVIRDKVGKEFQVVKICFDIGCIVLGFVLGGKLGVITIITALAAGPLIQFMTRLMQKRRGK